MADISKTVSDLDVHFSEATRAPLYEKLSSRAYAPPSAFLSDAPETTRDNIRKTLTEIKTSLTSTNAIEIARSYFSRLGIDAANWNSFATDFCADDSELAYEVKSLAFDVAAKIVMTGKSDLSNDSGRLKAATFLSTIVTVSFDDDIYGIRSGDIFVSGRDPSASYSLSGQNDGKKIYTRLVASLNASLDSLRPFCDRHTLTIEQDDTVDFMVEPDSYCFIADAGADGVRDEDVPDVLSGAKNFVSDGSELKYDWTQTSGPAVKWLGAKDTAYPIFRTPQVFAAGVKLEFQLTVTDSRGHTLTDTVERTINNTVNEAPRLKVSAPKQVIAGEPFTITAHGVDDNPDDTLSYGVRLFAVPQEKSYPSTIRIADNSTITVSDSFGHVVSTHYNLHSPVVAPKITLTPILGLGPLHASEEKPSSESNASRVFYFVAPNITQPVTATYIVTLSDGHTPEQHGVVTQKVSVRIIPRVTIQPEKDAKLFSQDLADIAQKTGGEAQTIGKKRKDTAAVDPLIKTLKDPSQKNPDTVERLIALTDNEMDSKENVFISPTGKTWTKADTLAAALERGVEFWPIQYMADAYGKTVDDYLLDLQSPDANTRRLAAENLFYQTDPRVVPALLTAIRKEPDPFVGEKMVGALAHHHAPEAIEYYREYLKKDHYQVGHYDLTLMEVISLVGSLRDVDSHPLLKSILQNHPVDDKGNERLASTAALLALACIGHPDDYEYLLQQDDSAIGKISHYFDDNQNDTRHSIFLHAMSLYGAATGDRRTWQYMEEVVKMKLNLDVRAVGFVGLAKLSTVDDLPKLIALLDNLAVASDKEYLQSIIDNLQKPEKNRLSPDAMRDEIQAHCNRDWNSRGGGGME